MGPPSGIIMPKSQQRRKRPAEGVGAARAAATDPFIAGTNVPIYRISALLDGGANVEEVMRDFPSLTRAQIEGALEYSKASPNQGRPYPSRSLKRALREMDFDLYLNTKI